MNSLPCSGARSVCRRRGRPGYGREGRADVSSEASRPPAGHDRSGAGGQTCRRLSPPPIAPIKMTITPVSLRRSCWFGAAQQTSRKEPRPRCTRRPTVRPTGGRRTKTNYHTTVQRRAATQLRHSPDTLSTFHVTRSLESGRHCNVAVVPGRPAYRSSSRPFSCPLQCVRAVAIQLRPPLMAARIPAGRPASALELTRPHFLFRTTSHES